MTASFQTRSVSLSDPETWAAELRGLPHAVAHSHGFRSALDGGRDDAECLLFVAERDGAKAVCPILERPFDGRIDAATPYGFGGFVGQGDLTGLDQAWKAFARERGYVAGYLAQHPSLACGDFGSADERFEAASVYLLDLRPEEDAIISGMSKRRRPSLRRWLRETEIVTDRAELVEAFVRLYPPHMSRLGAASVYFFGDAALKRMAELDDVVLFGVRDEEGEIEAVSMTAVTPPCADYLFFAATETARDHSVGLIWRGISEAKARGAAWINLGGAIREGDGVGEFKRRFGAVMTPSYCLKQVYDAGGYRALCAQASCEASDRSGYFPAYRRSRN